MTEYRFNVIVEAELRSHEEMLDAAEALAEAGCTDATVCGHAEGMELIFERSADSLQAAIASAIVAIESTGYRVLRVEMEREAITI